MKINAVVGKINHFILKALDFMGKKERFCWQCCGSGMFIPDPDFYPSRIPDLGSRMQKQQQKRGVKKNCCQTLFCSHKFHKTENYFVF
jgi:hypothetical protein